MTIMYNTLEKAKTFFLPYINNINLFFYVKQPRTVFFQNFLLGVWFWF